MRALDFSRNALVAFLVLFGVMAGYALLETARDAVFLRYLPATQLPWAYLAAAGAVSLAALGSPLLGRGPRGVGATLLGFAGVLLAAWRMHPRGAAGAYAIYTLVCLTGTVVIARVWTLIGGLFTVGEARRAFAPIAAGGAIGSIVGAALAARITSSSDAQALIGIGAAILGLTGIAVLAMPASVVPVQKTTTALRQVSRSQYARQVFWMVVGTTLATTIADLLFKSTAAASTAPAQLGTFFARYQLAVGVIGLLMQLAVAPMLLRRVSADRLVLILPSVLAIAGVGAVALPGLAASLVTKGLDVALRGSVHRTSTEVLYLPLPADLRARLKTLVDGVGQRVAQALASLLVLGLTAVGVPYRHLALGVSLAAVLALLAAQGLRRQYIQLFRELVLDGKLAPAQVAELDLASVESLVEMLSSPNDARVLSALETLVAQRKAKLIPSLLVYHPSPRVAVRSLEILSDETERRDFLPLTERLLRHPEPRLRVTAARARAARARGADELRPLVDDPGLEIAVTGLVALVRIDAATPRERRRLAELGRRGDREVRLALLEAIARMPSPGLAELARAIDPGGDAELQLAVAQALRACGDDAALPLALELLGVRALRDPARRIFLSAGAAGVAFLARALWDPAVELRLRRHIPRTLSRFGNAEAAAVLLDGLTREGADRVTRHKMMRGLGRMRHDQPALPIDQDTVEGLAHAALERARRLRQWGRAFADAHEGAAVLLRRMLTGKEEMAYERLFRLIDLLRPGEEMERVFHGLKDADDARRAGSRELLELVLPDALRAEVLAYVDGTEEVAPISVDEALEALREDRSAALRALAGEVLREQVVEVRHAS